MSSITVRNPRNYLWVTHVGVIEVIVTLLHPLLKRSSYTQKFVFKQFLDLIFSVFFSLKFYNLHRHW